MGSDLLDDFVTLTHSVNSPDIYRTWCGISLIAGAGERRVWVKTGEFTTFLNLIVLLVGRPGTGKFIIETVKELWKQTPDPMNPKAKAFRVAPMSMSKASLMDALKNSEKTILPPDGGKAVTFHAMQVAAEELGILIPAYDLDYISAVVGIFSNPAEYTETRRASEVKELIIEYPTMNLILGSQPSYLETFLPDNVWNSGLGRRIIMVYSQSIQKRDPFFVAPKNPELRKSVLERLSKLSLLYGEISWSDDAQAEFRDWALVRGGHPLPDHSKLVSYLETRWQFIMKLSGVMVLSRQPHGPMQIQLDDFVRARNLLIDAESVMPDLFREMKGKSDAQILESLHRFGVTMFPRYRDGIPGTMFYSFLSDHAPVEKIGQLMAQAERSGLLERVAGGDDWKPRPKYQHEVE